MFFEELNVEYIAERISYEVSDRVSLFNCNYDKGLFAFLKYIELYFYSKRSLS